MSVILPFNRLLNTISHDMNRQNLISLIHTCEPYIPESRREEITHGWELFQILKHQNVIGDDPEKACNLLQIMREMKPKRKDIIFKVKEFIRNNYDPNYDFESSSESFVYAPRPSAILVDHPNGPNHLQTHSFSSYSSRGPASSYEQHLSGHGHSSSPIDVHPTHTENQCTLDCCCFACNCYSRRIPSCVLLIMALVMAVLTLLSSLFWFKKIPKRLYDKMGQDGADIGGYVVGCFCVLTVIFLGWWIVRKVKDTRTIPIPIPYENFVNHASSSENVFVDEEKGGRVEIQGSTNAIASVKTAKRKRKKGSGADSTTPGSSASASLPVRVQQQPFPTVTSRQLSYPDGKSLMEDGGLQTDGACDSYESDDFHSKESLFPVESDEDCSDDHVIPPTTAE